MTAAGQVYGALHTHVDTASNDAITASTARDAMQRLLAGDQSGICKALRSTCCWLGLLPKPFDISIRYRAAGLMCCYR